MNYFEATYRGTPPWDIGRPQPELIRLENLGEIKGPGVLDVGCGTGDNALFLAEHGYQITGIDTAPTAIAKATRKARKRNLKADFLVFDALELESLGRVFNTVVDSGLFHVLSNGERSRFLRGLAAVLAPGGVYHLLCFSRREKRLLGPRRLSPEEIRGCFSGPWEEKRLEEARFATNLRRGWSWAWLASFARL